MKPRLHLVAPAGSCRSFLTALGQASQYIPTSSPGSDPGAGPIEPSMLMALIQEIVGTNYHVTGRPELMAIEEAEKAGGRTDDQVRAEDIESALADDTVAALVGLRGGAWFTRILPRIDFSVLDRRSRPLAVFGFSELTTLVNLVAAHANGRGIYDMGPAFLQYGLKRHAETVLRLPVDPSAHPSSESWARRELIPQFRDYFRDVVSMIEGRGSQRGIEARLVRGDLPERLEARFVGGNLCVLTTMLGSRYRRCIDPSGRWLVLEDLNEKPERLDRFLSHLTLAGYWEHCSGVLLGDFHRGDQQLVSAVAEMLRIHWTSCDSVPLLVTQQVGHIWPMSPLPLNLPTTIQRKDAQSLTIHWPPQALKTVG